jgi:hypothetical protein
MQAQIVGSGRGGMGLNTFVERIMKETVKYKIRLELIDDES